jgi:DNA-binding YbaB/EbfC family protein
MKDLSGLMRQAQGMQQKLEAAQAEMAARSFQGTAGAGLVSLALKGSGELTALTIAPSLFADGDAETLADLVRAAHADARTQIEAASAELMRSVMGPLAGMAGGLKGLNF